MTNKQMIKNHYTAYGKLIKKASACTNKRKALQSLKKKVRLLLDEGRG